MFDFTTLFEFSRNHCIEICAFLVPANLLATLRTLILTGQRKPTARIWFATSIAAFFAGLMVLHVTTWFLVGVVMAPTFILLTLGSVCLSINLWAIFGRESLARLLVSVYKFCTRVDLPALLNLHE
ncbi:hypothetical protein C7B65_10430 [Phormidesmis priestleyi ULC007]|uniref:Uncharacterized protein n=1 Tax=Phormidesmis priestleyi ULC007 TaxID=1920490 RepID=A0A2T1DGS2_9CYAN|nr:hypothetical protein [Phormidesmis priestleyi]PSB19700.1 hypothetical protein C7B65_10430 [Phormidesmis priestleyi ULC007]PZO53584.1 MAG: hypothetical protein DCF14_04135 [Phormidesmis priestleyi]